jgi:hypothetical protein
MRPGARFGDDQSLLIAFPLREDGRRTIVTPNRSTDEKLRHCIYADCITDELQLALRLHAFATRGFDGIGGGVKAAVHSIQDDDTRLVWDGASLRDDTWKVG